MKRINIQPRANWQQKCERLGFDFHSIGDGYWNESAYYEFTPEQIDDIETATIELHEMCLEAVDYVLRHELLYRYQLPPDMYDLVYASWDRKDPCLYGRFDFAYDGQGLPKLLEYNADTPTSLLECSDVQDDWRNECFPTKHQFNGIRRAFVQAWKAAFPGGSSMHVSCIKHSSEDYGTVDFMRRMAVKAGIKTHFVYVEDIGWDNTLACFVDASGRQIEALLKLYPWEWMVIDPYHIHLRTGRTKFIEPMWKMILSNKALLPILWERFPNHPNLLPASFYPHILESNFVKKPLLSREGANITIMRNGESFETSGVYGAEGFVYQEHFDIPCFDGRYPIIGSWVIGGHSCGIGIREDATRVTKNTSFFVPHIFQ